MKPLSQKTKNLIMWSLVTALVVVLYFVAVSIGFFYMFWWYDSVLHILGGIALGFLGMALFPRRIGSIMGLVTGVAVLWEVFERVGHIVLPKYLGFGGTGDTILDILCAIIGAALVLIFFNEPNT